MNTIPDFEVPATGGQRFASAAFRGHRYILYFYPKDDTPGCTVEGLQFRDLHAQFRKAGYMVFGVSRDTVASHERFKAKMSFPFELLSDGDETMCKLFGVIKEKVMGIERSTFIMGPNNEILKEWRGLKADGHAAEVLNSLESL